MSSDSPGTVPPIDESKPHSARVWNYLLGGKDNYTADREAAEAYVELHPHIRTVARISRYWLIRGARFLAGECGIRQFLDVGAGLPLPPDTVHDVVQRIVPDARVVYVDNDPLVLAHAQALLRSTPQGETAYIDADLRDPQAILTEAGHTLDLSRPVGIISSDVMGHVQDTQEAYRLVRALVDGVAPGSYLMLSHGTDEDPGLTAAQEAYNRTEGAVPYRLRSAQEIARFFDGLELVEPGVVHQHAWRPDISGLDSGTPVPGVGYAGVARIP